MMYWRDISTAPKDGRRIVLGCADNLALAQWQEDQEGWFDAHGQPISFTPTHWDGWETPETVQEVEERYKTEQKRIFDNHYYKRFWRFLVRACYWYYVKNTPRLSDQEFDQHFAELREMEESGKIDISPESPTQMIYGDQESQYPDWAKEDVRMDVW